MRVIMTQFRSKNLSFDELGSLNLVTINETVGWVKGMGEYGRQAVPALCKYVTCYLIKSRSENDFEIDQASGSYYSFMSIDWSVSDVTK